MTHTKRKPLPASEETHETPVYKVYDVLRAEYNLEPLACLASHSNEVVFLHYAGDTACQDCGHWRLEIDLPPDHPEYVNRGAQT